MRLPLAVCRRMAHRSFYRYGYLLGDALIRKGNSDSSFRSRSSDGRMKIAEEAVDVFRKLGEIYPGRYGNKLSEALRQLSELNLEQRPSLAIALALESVDLSEESTSGSSIVRSGALRQLAGALLNAGRVDEAKEVANRCVARHREASEILPRIERVEFAKALHTLSACTGSDGLHAEAIELARESVATFSRLNPFLRTKNTIPYMRAKIALAWELYQTDRYEEAIEHATSAERSLGNISSVLPYLEPVRVNALELISMCWRSLNRLEEAKSASERALGILRRLHAKDPGRDSVALSVTLIDLGEIYEQESNFCAAAASFIEVGELSLKFLAANPRYETKLASDVRRLCFSLGRAGRPNEAIDARAMALRLYRRHEAENENLIVTALHEQAISFSSAARHDEAISAWSEAIVAREALIDSDDDLTHKAYLAVGYRWRSTEFKILDKYDEALSDITRAIEIYRQASNVDEIYLPQVAYSLELMVQQFADRAQIDRIVSALMDLEAHARDVRISEVDEIRVRTFDAMRRRFAAEIEDAWRSMTGGDYPNSMIDPDAK